MSDRKLTIRVAECVAVTALRTEAAGAGVGWTFVYAPGAGSNLHDPFGAYAARALAAEGITTVRFQFPYMEAGKRAPDRPPVLEATWRAIIEAVRGDAVRGDAGRMVVGGRSMGGRMASMAVADGAAVDALALFAYPLHPPGRPDHSRVEHLAAIRVPALFCSGTNDAFGTPDELRAAARKVKRAKVYLLAAADHGFSAPKASGRTREEIWAEALGALREWLAGL
jgi:hypothetical protein